MKATATLSVTDPGGLPLTLEAFLFNEREEATWEADVIEAVRQARGGHEDASRWLVKRLYPLVIKIVRSHRPKRTDEEDLAQMIFVRVFSRLDQWRPQAPFEHWVSRVAVNVCLSQIQYERVRPEWRMADLSEDQVEVLAETAADPDASDHGNEIADRELVAKLLDAMAPRDRLVLQLLDLEGKSVETASEITGWSKSMVKVQAFRARRKMRKLITELLKERRP